MSDWIISEDTVASGVYNVDTFKVLAGFTLTIEP